VRQAHRTHHAAPRPHPSHARAQDTFCLTFSVEMDFFGDLRTISLKPGGDNIPVTEENRHEYVQLMVEYLLSRSVQRQFEAFAVGFRILCHGPAIRLFNACEVRQRARRRVDPRVHGRGGGRGACDTGGVGGGATGWWAARSECSTTHARALRTHARTHQVERLVCGNPNLDFEALERNSKYEGGFSVATPAVQWLWHVSRSCACVCVCVGGGGVAGGVWGGGVAGGVWGEGGRARVAACMHCVHTCSWLAAHALAAQRCARLCSCPHDPTPHTNRL
jgi:hypothetical protein